MEEFAVIGLDTQEKRAEAEEILKELGYRSDEGWNKDYRTLVDYGFVITYKEGIYCCHNHDGGEKEVTLDQLRAKLKLKQMENVVVKVLNKEHGEEVIQAFKDLGVDTHRFIGSSVGNYYGLFDGLFNYYSTSKESKVITLEELKAMKVEVKQAYPCMMEVWDYEKTNPVKANVISEVEHKGFKGYVVDLYENGDFVVYMNARPIQPDPLKEVVEGLNCQLSIIKNNPDKSDWGIDVTLTPNEAQLIIDALEKNEK